MRSPPMNVLDALERRIEEALNRPGFEAGDPAYASGKRDGLHFALEQIMRVREEMDAQAAEYEALDGPGVAWSGDAQ